MRKYSTAKNPNDGMWYVIGFAGNNKAGRGQWVPVSSGFATKAAAAQQIPHQVKADAAAKAELKAL